MYCIEDIMIENIRKMARHLIEKRCFDNMLCQCQTNHKKTYDGLL